MDEVVIDRAQIVLAMREHVEQLRAHAHQRDGAAGREVEPAEQFLPARFRGGVQLGSGIVVRVLVPAGDGRLHARLVGAETLGQRLEEGDTGAGGEFRIAGQDFARERDAGGLAAAGQEMIAEFDQALGPA